MTKEEFEKIPFTLAGSVVASLVKTEKYESCDKRFTLYCISTVDDDSPEGKTVKFEYDGVLYDSEEAFFEAVASL